MKGIFLSMTAISMMSLVSCSNDDTDVVDNGLTTPTVYKFERNNETSVSFSGQSTRIAMAEELISALKVDSKKKDELGNMFAHEKGSIDFSDSALNESSKSIRSKVAASADYFLENTTEANTIRETFDGYITKQVDEVFENWDQGAGKGQAGMIQENGGGDKRYVNAKGLEYNQAFAKGLIGALMVDQMLNNYLSTKVLDAGDNRANNDAGTVEEGKNYTTMEHKWDEAYGYLYGAEDNNGETPVLGKDSFLNKYLNSVNKDDDFKDIADKIFNAFALGRAAIVAKNYAVRDAQIAILKENISKVIAVRAVYYLQAGKTNLAAGDNGSAFHDLSEGYGFIQSLRFTQNAVGAPYITKEKIDGYLTTLQEGDGFYTITAQTLDDMSNEIAAAFSFTVEQAK